MTEANKEQFYRISYSYMKNKDEALDVLQESIYKGYISLEKLKSSEYMKTWFTRILINTAINSLNKMKKISFLEDNNTSQSDNYNSKTKDYSHDDKMDLWNALEKLSEKEKSIVVLRYFEDYKLEEISDTLEIPLSTAKSTLYRALEKLKIKLESEV